MISSLFIYRESIEMEATEFVKKYGWFGAKEYLAGATFLNDNLFVFTNVEDLQNLVNAYELVESYGGLQGAKDHLNNRREYGLYSLPKLKQAIELVESVDE